MDFKSKIVEEILQEMKERLQEHIPRALREAQLLMMAHLRVDELWLMSHKKDVLEQTQELYIWMQRRSKCEPLEYITQKVSFYSQEFFITKGALIPRPETELLIDEVVKNFPDTNAAIHFVEVGIGSGIISIILAKKYVNARFTGVDISQAALSIAKINIEKFALQERIELRLGSLLEPVNEKIDYLVSNPPYIENGIFLEKNLSYEPQNALFGGEVGDEIIQKLLDSVLRDKITFFSCEMGYDQKGKIRNYLHSAEYGSLQFYKDYSNFDRGFTLKV